MTIRGPQGTGDRFKNKVAQLKAKGLSDLVARKRVALAGIRQNKRRKNVR